MIECNGVKVWELEFKDLFDGVVGGDSFKQRSFKVWAREVKTIAFGQQDTATETFKAAGKLVPRMKSWMLNSTLTTGRNGANYNYYLLDFCYEGYYMTTEGCLECLRNTYSARGAAACTACPSDMVAPPGSTSQSTCSNIGLCLL